jgi:hypothetical protein
VDNTAPRVTDVFPVAGALGILYPAARKAKLNPNKSLPPATTLEVFAGGAKDLAGNLLSARKVWYFTTRR